jgi:hypothetical protein
LYLPEKESTENSPSTLNFYAGHGFFAEIGWLKTFAAVYYFYIEFLKASESTLYLNLKS